MSQQTSALVDGFGRQIHYLRLSVTDRCDFRCVYCMSEQIQFLPRDQVLTLEEMLCLAQVFVSLGVRKVRLTGGEPLVRRNLLWLVERLGQLPIELVMTTNASQLTRFAQPLAEAGVSRLNISLDTLNPERFRQLARTDRLAQVLQAAEDCTPETHEAAWRAVYECLGWNPDTARERYLERRA